MVSVDDRSEVLIRVNYPCLLIDRKPGGDATIALEGFDLGAKLSSWKRHLLDACTYVGGSFYFFHFLPLTWHLFQGLREE